MCDSRFYYIAPNGKLTRVATLPQALDAARNEGFAWLDYYQPTKEELSVLIDPLHLNPLSIEDCTDKNQVPKIEDFPGHTFVVFSAFSYADMALAVDEVDLFIGEKFLISVSGYDSEARRPLNDVEHIVERDIESAKQGPAFLMHVILDYVVDQKFVAIEALADELDAAEEKMLADPAGFNPAEMLRMRRVLLALRKSLFHEREILVKICRKDCPFISEKAIFHYRDIYDHLAKFFELTEAYRDILTSLMELYTSMLNNLMAKTSNETNATVRRLTFITTIFMPLTLLAGIGGMSEWSMMTGPENWKIAYPAFLLAMAIIGIANYYVLKRVGK
ncbi:MAG TPA: magnesium transporter CorA family protein [Armatimonadota bacterium]